jgi:histidinol-phosphate aminotransferase
MTLADPLAASTSRRTFARLLGVGAFAAFSPLDAAAPPAAPSAQAPGAAAAPPGDPYSPVQIDSNENPYGPPPTALAAIAAALPLGARYPDRAVDELVEALAAHHGVSAESITLGAGSSQILHAAANAVCAPDVGAVTAQPTFEALARYAERRGAPVARVPLTSDFRHDLPAMAAAAGERALVYVCNPNNPTASLTPADELRRFLERLPPTVTVLVDEAYHEYAVGEAGYESVVPWLARFPNLIVARTFSKVFGLAGLRCGYAVASPARIEELERQLPWDVSSLPALVAAKAALADAAFVERAQALNREIRRETVRALAAHGVAVVPSAANFFFADLGADVAPVIEALRAQGVRVGRRFAALPNHLRVTVGTGDEMRRFLAAFEEVRPSAKAA